MSAERSEKLSDVFPLVPLLVGVQSLRHVWLFVTPQTAAGQVSLSFTISRSFLKLMPIELVMPSNHLILCHSLLLLPPIFPCIRVFSNESALHIWWPKYWNLSVSSYKGTNPITSGSHPYTSLNLNYVLRGPSLKTANVGFKGFKLCIWEIQPFCPQHLLKCGFWFRISL